MNCIIWIGLFVPVEREREREIIIKPCSNIQIVILTVFYHIYLVYFFLFSVMICHQEGEKIKILTKKISNI